MNLGEGTYGIFVGTFDQLQKHIQNIPFFLFIAVDFGVDEGNFDMHLKKNERPVICGFITYG